jgi:hypothetical protein
MEELGSEMWKRQSTSDDAVGVNFPEGEKNECANWFAQMTNSHKGLVWRKIHFETKNLKIGNIKSK